MDPLTNLFWMEGLTIIKHKTQNSSIIEYRKYKTFFGVSPNVCGVVWKLLKQKPQGSQPKHLLWSLLLLKTYNKEHVNASLAGADEKTFREWSWKFVKMLSDLRVVKWGNRFKNAKYGNMFVTLDGTDCRIQEPRPFNKKWFSHKFNATGVRYEIGLAIGTGVIVWASSGFPCGEWPENGRRICRNFRNLRYSY